MSNLYKGLVSIIVTTYNRKDLLQETLSAILRQTYRETEVIVVDNFSDYDIEKSIRLFRDSRIRFFQHRNSGIIAVNRNYGIRQAQGEFIAFCDDDDLWMPDKLEIQIAQLYQDDIVGLGSAATLIGDLRYSRPALIARDRILSFEDIYQLNSVALSSLVIKNEGILFDEDPDLIGVEDFDFQLRVTLRDHSKIKLLARPLIHYRIHTHNESADVQKVQNAIKVIKKYRDEVPDINTGHMISDRYVYCGKLALRYSCRKSREYFRKALVGGKINLSACFFLVLSYLPASVIQKTILLYFKALQKIR
jgi:glycosyltransferase involved in cell wall biosynthesis